MSSQAHGHTPAAWTGSAIVFLGFCVSGAAMIMASVPIFWVGIAVILAGGVVAKAMSMAGMGKVADNTTATVIAEARARAAAKADVAATAEPAAVAAH
ncbi:ABC-type dipeptide/oligopeptide/nickel transport system permease component [Kitasatospora sp. GAS204A]|uniref:HGxxPAAW family protein n=1 Tax=unclassified Kitasatospora TaxID=2633591 RepID=UPI002476BF78|nr:HGxxPAAW family protein [Kitasatospora sp. GAS204B]MDH6115984.1 ABC-type dipeptide/oligopeptide/nickel transport system permease component [Kitasatospora sp. GAS204B]